MKIFNVLSAAALLASGLAFPATAQTTKPLKVLLLTGAFGHDHKTQKDILKKGIEERANVVIEQLHTEGDLAHPPLPILNNPDYAKGYDLVIHDVMTPQIFGRETVRDALAPHVAQGIPAVVLHVGVSAYRSGPSDKMAWARQPGDVTWTELGGVIVKGHGPSFPIAVTYTDPKNPITRNLSNWTTPVPEELYHQLEVFPGTQIIASGEQVKKASAGGAPEKGEQAVLAWTNVYQNKTRIFSTSLGHNNVTVSDPRYLDLVTNGLLWAAGKLDDSGKPLPGYGPGGK